MDMTDYLKNELRDHVLKAASYTAPTNVYLATFSTATTDAGGGTETTGGSYARQVVSAWTDGDDGACTNTNAISIAGMPAGLVSHLALFDASSGGNMLLHGEFKGSRTFVAGETFQIAAGALSVTWN